MHHVRQDQGIGRVCQHSAQEPGHCGTNPDGILYTVADHMQKCFDCMQEQVDEQPIDEDKYQDSSTAFNPPEHSAGNYPEYFSSANSITDASSTNVSTLS